MHPRTEDLLTLRDGEPIDAVLREDLLADPEAVAELDRLRRMRTALRDLPEIEPTEDAWPRVAAELDRDDAAVRASRCAGPRAPLLPRPSPSARSCISCNCPESRSMRRTTFAAADPPGFSCGAAGAAFIRRTRRRVRALERVLARIPASGR